MTAAQLVAWLRLRLLQRLAWRADWWLGLLADAVTAAGGLLMVVALFSRAPSLEGYTRDELIACWGLAEASRQLFWMVGRGLYDLNGRYVVGGELDRVLLRPVSPIGQILVENVHLGAWPGVVWGLLAVAWAAPLPWTPARVAWVAASVVVGALLLGVVTLTWASLGFWVLHRGRMVGLVHQVATWASWPPSFMPPALAWALLTVLPFLFLGWAPGLGLVRADAPWWSTLGPAVTLAHLPVAGFAWRAGLARYGSTGT